MRHIIFLTLYCLLSLSSTKALAYAEKIEIYTELLPPFQTLDNNQVAGKATHRVKQLLQLANLNAHFNIVPWARAFNTVKQKENTLIYSMHRSPERESQFHWLAVVAQIKNGFVALKSKKIKLNSLTKAKSYVTAVVRDSFANEYLKSQGFSENVNLLIVDSRETQLNLLLNGKVDFLFLDLSFMREKLKAKGLSPLLVEHVLTQPEWAKDLYLAINKKSDIKLINRFKNAISTLE